MNLILLYYLHATVSTITFIKIVLIPILTVIVPILLFPWNFYFTCNNEFFMKVLKLN